MALAPAQLPSPLAGLYLPSKADHSFSPFPMNKATAFSTAVTSARVLFLLPPSPLGWVEVGGGWEQASAPDSKS